VKRAILLWLAAALCACTPSLDWRDVSPEGSGLRLMLPCKPSVFGREVVVAGQATTWTVLSCQAAAATWSIGHGQVSDPAAVGAVLQALAAPAPGALRVASAWPGFTPHGDAGRWRWSYRDAQGRSVRGETVAAPLGLRVVRASVIGAQLDAEAVEFFFGSLRPQR
jgi:hypothetical protein